MAVLGWWDNLLGQFILRNFLYSSFVGYRHVRGVRQPRINLVEIAGQNAKRYLLKLVVFRGPEDFYSPSIAGGFAFFCTWRHQAVRRGRKNRSSKGLSGYSHSVAAGGLCAKECLGFETGVFSAIEPPKTVHCILWGKNENSML